MVMKTMGLARLSTCLLGFLLFVGTNGGSAQNLNHIQQVVDTLCHPQLHGRGYVNQGDLKAARYIRDQYKKYGLKQFKMNGNKSYFQDFRLKVNRFPGDMLLKADGVELKAGEDYLVKPKSGGTSRERYLGVVRFKGSFLNSQQKLDSFIKQDLSNKCVVIEQDSAKQWEKDEAFQSIQQNEMDAAAIAYLTNDELTWAVSTETKEYPVLTIRKEHFPEEPSIMELNVENDYTNSYPTQNVLGYIKGSENPDQYILLSGHYDHLGRMGNDAYFPGANDNASGIGMLLELARHFSREGNQPDYSIAFAAFTGEELGLIGSRFYTTQPAFPLDQIRLMLNMDLMGNGKNGMMVVNGKVFEDEFNQLTAINEEHNYLPEIKKRGRAANSDHYFFSKNGVPSFFFYLREDYPHYHDVYDKPEELTYNKVGNTFRLIVHFIGALN